MSRPGSGTHAYAKLVGFNWQYYMTKDVVTLGRGPDCDVQITGENSVSRHHLRLRHAPECGAVELTNLSKNGILVNGKYVQDASTAVALRCQTDIAYGRQEHMRVTVVLPAGETCDTGNGNGNNGRGVGRRKPRRTAAAAKVKTVDLDMDMNMDLDMDMDELCHHGDGNGHGGDEWEQQQQEGGVVLLDDDIDFCRGASNGTATGTGTRAAAVGGVDMTVDGKSLALVDLIGQALAVHRRQVLQAREACRADAVEHPQQSGVGVGVNGEANLFEKALSNSQQEHSQIQTPAVGTGCDGLLEDVKVNANIGDEDGDDTIDPASASSSPPSVSPSSLPLPPPILTPKTPPPEKKNMNMDTDTTLDMNGLVAMLRRMHPRLRTNRMRDGALRNGIRHCITTNENMFDVIVDPAAASGSSCNSSSSIPSGGGRMNNKQKKKMMAMMAVDGGLTTTQPLPSVRFQVSDAFLPRFMQLTLVLEARQQQRTTTAAAGGGNRQLQQQQQYGGGGGRGRGRKRLRNGAGQFEARRAPKQQKTLDDYDEPQQHFSVKPNPNGHEQETLSVRDRLKHDKQRLPKARMATRLKPKAATAKHRATTMTRAGKKARRKQRKPKARVRMSRVAAREEGLDDDDDLDEDVQVEIEEEEEEEMEEEEEEEEFLNIVGSPVVSSEELGERGNIVSAGAAEIKSDVDYVAEGDDDDDDDDVIEGVQERGGEDEDEDEEVLHIRRRRAHVVNVIGDVIDVDQLDDDDDKQNKESTNGIGVGGGKRNRNVNGRGMGETKTEDMVVDDGLILTHDNTGGGGGGGVLVQDINAGNVRTTMDAATVSDIASGMKNKKKKNTSGIDNKNNKGRSMNDGDASSAEAGPIAKAKAELMTEVKLMVKQNEKKQRQCTSDENENNDRTTGNNAENGGSGSMMSTAADAAAAGGGGRDDRVIMRQNHLDVKLNGHIVVPVDAGGVPLHLIALSNTMAAAAAAAAVGGTTTAGTATAAAETSGVETMATRTVETTVSGSGSSSVNADGAGIGTGVVGVGVVEGQQE